MTNVYTARKIIAPVQNILTNARPDGAGGMAPMEFEWDEAKRLMTIEKHGLDFRDVQKVLLTNHLVLAAKSDAEQRHLAVGLSEGRLVAIVFTLRGENIRLITARRAREYESRAYYARFP